MNCADSDWLDRQYPPMRLRRLRDVWPATDVDGVIAEPAAADAFLLGVGVRVGMLIDMSNAGDSFRVVRELYDERETGGRRRA